MAYKKLQARLFQGIEYFEKDDIKEGIRFFRELALIEKYNIRIPTIYGLFRQEKMEELGDDLPKKERIKMIQEEWKQKGERIKMDYTEQREAYMEQKRQTMEDIHAQIHNKDLLKGVITKKRRRITRVKEAMMNDTPKSPKDKKRSPRIKIKRRSTPNKSSPSDGKVSPGPGSPLRIPKSDEQEEDQEEQEEDDFPFREDDD